MYSRGEVIPSQASTQWQVRQDKNGRDTESWETWF